MAEVDKEKLGFTQIKPKEEVSKALEPAKMKPIKPSVTNTHGYDQ